MRRQLLYGLGAILAAVTGLAMVANSAYYALPSWSQKIACAVGNCPRFIELADWNREAVLDRETGLVWEKSPNTTERNWFLAQNLCNSQAVGGRKGWRVPTLQELTSLVDADPANIGSPKLPPGHPFINVQSSGAALYWSATTFAFNTASAWRANLDIGTLGGVSAGDKNATTNNYVWCVRGGQGGDVQ